MKLPKGTPRIGLLGETGCLPMELRIHKRKLGFLHRLTAQHDETRWTHIVQKYQDDLNIHDDKHKKFVKTFENKIEMFNEDIIDKLTEAKEDIWKQIHEASTRIDEFMIPKLWLSKVNSKTGGFVNEGASLGLYVEDGKHNNKPSFKQINGSYTLQFTNDNKWMLQSPSASEKEEIFIQMNPQFPNLGILFYNFWCQINPIYYSY